MVRGLVNGIKEILINETDERTLPFFRNYSEVAAAEIKGNVAFVDTRSGTVYTAKKEFEGFIVAHVAANGIVKEGYYQDKDVQKMLDEERWEVLYSLSQPSENELFFKEQATTYASECKRLVDENILLRELLDVSRT